MYESALKSFAFSYIKNDEGRYSISMVNQPDAPMYQIYFILE